MDQRMYYEELFADYPDVVTILEFCQMLGGIADTTARKLIKSNAVKYLYARDMYLIPKVYVIDYVLSDHYREFRKKLRHKV